MNEDKDFEKLTEMSELPDSSTLQDSQELTEEPQESKSKNKVIFGALAAAVGVLAKFKFVILLVLGKLKFLFLALKLSKFAGTTISMLITILIYAKVYGVVYGVGVVLLLFVHEMGHYEAAKQLKLKVSGPVFIPFFGAFVGMKEMPSDAKVEAKLAAGGPFAGAMAAFACLLLYYLDGNRIFAALAYTGFILNLFNLIPLRPFDGGRIVTAISPKIWLVGIPVLAVFLIKFPNGFIFLFLILGIIDVYKYFKNSENREYYNGDGVSKLKFGLFYFGLIFALVGGMIATYGIKH